MSHLHLLLCFLLLGHLLVGLSVSVDLSCLYVPDTCFYSIFVYSLVLYCTRHLSFYHTTKPPPLFCLSGLFCPPSLLYQLDCAISLTLCQQFLLYTQSSQVIAFVFTLSHPSQVIHICVLYTSLCVSTSLL